MNITLITIWCGMFTYAGVFITKVSADNEADYGCCSAAVHDMDVVWINQPNNTCTRNAYFHKLKSKKQKQISTALINDRGCIIVAVDEGKQRKMGVF